MGTDAFLVSTRVLLQGMFRVRAMAWCSQLLRGFNIITYLRKTL